MVKSNGSKTLCEVGTDNPWPPLLAPPDGGDGLEKRTLFGHGCENHDCAKPGCHPSWSPSPHWGEEDLDRTC
jgi:hypothetical protein